MGRGSAARGCGSAGARVDGGSRRRALGPTAATSNPELGILCNSALTYVTAKLAMAIGADEARFISDKT